jgi:hypothetical protein
MQLLPRDLPAPTSPDRVIARLLTTAASQIGYREGRDPSGNWNNDNAFGRYFNQNGVSWCHWFASWAAVAAGIPATVIPRTGYTPTGWGWFTAHGRDVTSPRAGDLFYVYGYVPNEGNRVHHVGIVEKVLSGGRIQTIEGNTNTSGSAQGNGVYRLTRTVSSKLKFARPDYAAAVQAAVPPPPTTPAKPIPAKPATPDQTPAPEDTMTPAQMQELKDFIEARTQAYAVATNNYTRQVLATATKAILAAGGDATAAVAELNAELDARDAAMKKELDEISAKVTPPVAAPQA